MFAVDKKTAVVTDNLNIWFTIQKEGDLRMNYYIGEAAGKVYEFLADQKNGEATFSKIESNLDLNENFIKMGIGWLSHEGKVDLAGKGARTKVRLIEEVNN